jgi:hypothetical protein
LEVEELQKKEKNDRTKRTKEKKLTLSLSRPFQTKTKKGELGVWQGKLFLGMAGFAHPEEPLLAADWFTNDSDKGYLKGFVDNVRHYLGQHNLAKTLIFQGNTMALTPKWFADHKLPLFRMVSIDAGHSQECVMRDLNLIGW